MKQRATSEAVHRQPRSYGDGAPDETRIWWSDLRIARYAGFALAVLALSICLNRLGQRHALLGIVEYDDGVYLGAALRLVNGVVPYRDFDLAHPPGILLLLLPLSVLGDIGSTRALMGAARVQTALVAASNVLLLTRLVRHRGLPAVVIAGFFLAAFPAAGFADKTLMLEPYLVLFCLLGASAMFVGDELAGRNRLILAGLAFGFAGAIKIWALLPATVALLCCVPRVRHQLSPLLIGMVAGFAAPSLGFFSLAPKNYIRDVITVQLERSQPNAPSIGDRLVYITGVPILPSAALATAIVVSYVLTVTAAFVVPTRPTRLTWFALGAASLAVAALLAAPGRLYNLAIVPHFPGAALGSAIAIGYASMVTAAFLVRPRPTRLDWFALGTASLTGAALLGAPTFYPHYAYFSAVFLAFLFAVSCDRLVRAIRRTKAARVDSRLGNWRGLVPTMAAAVVVLVVVGGIPSPILHELIDDPGPAIARSVPVGACVVTDYPALAITANRFVPDSPGCPGVVDSYYTWLVEDPGKRPPSDAPSNRDLVGKWRAWFSAAEYVILSRSPSQIPWTPGLRLWFHHHFHQVSSDGASVYRRAGDRVRP